MEESSLVKGKARQGKKPSTKLSMPPRVNASTARSSIRRAVQATKPTNKTLTTTTNPSKSSYIPTCPAATERHASLQNHLPSTLPRTVASSRHYATTATVSGAGPVPKIPLGSLRLPDDYVPPTQPPSARRPETRKSQMLRAYTALLRSTPLILFLQHNNVTAVEWAAIRRELRAALAQVEDPAPGVESEGGSTMAAADISSAIELQVLRTRIFDVALKITEFFDPSAAAQGERSNTYTHDLSMAAYQTIKKAPTDDPATAYAQISPLLVGPVAAVTFPAASPAHLAAVLRVLAPNAAAGFPPPTRKKSPGYYELSAQSGLQKLILVGGRIEGRVFDNDAVRWVGGIKGGLGGLRAQLVATLQGAGLGLTTALEGGAKGLWFALEGRKSQLEEESDGGKKKEEAKEGEEVKAENSP